MTSNQNFDLSVPQPCHEQWNEMSVTERGAHCKACEKEVMDFTNMPLAKVKQTIEAFHGDVCGRFRTTDLVKPRFAHRGWSVFRRFAFAILLSFGLTLFNFADGYSRTILRDTQEVVFEQLEDYELNSLRIKGTVATATELLEYLPGATIALMIDDVVQVGTYTDYDGNFTLEVPAYLAPKIDQAKLVVSFVGYTTTELEMLDFSESGEAHVEVRLEGQPFTLRTMSAIDIVGVRARGSGTVTMGISRREARIERVPMYHGIPDTDRISYVQNTNYSEDW